MMMKQWRQSKRKYALLFTAILSIVVVMTACSQEETAQQDTVQGQSHQTTLLASGAVEKAAAHAKQGQMKLAPANGRIGTSVTITATGLLPNQALTVLWDDDDGYYAIGENNYNYIGTAYTPIEKEVLTGIADDKGEWTGEFLVPDGFGDNHDVRIIQEKKKIAQANFFVETYFTMTPTSGPIGTEITIEGEGLSSQLYGSLWHLNYDNNYTGMITAVSTNGRATAKIRATGAIGDHSLTIEGGSSGFPYLNRAQSAINYIHTQRFTFTVTDDQPAGGVESLTYTDYPVQAANGGIVMPEAANKKGVTITLDKQEGIVGEPIVMTGTGLPKNKTLSLVWHTMIGNRVTAAMFAENELPLGDGEVKTNSKGEFEYAFTVPDDLGGLPHLIEVKSGKETYGQTYLRILPSIVEIKPQSGPPGTEFSILIKGSGWTEFDNTYNMVYNNANIGYICGFNSQGSIWLPLVATGEPGYQVIDIYPGIYKGEEIQPNLYLRPQLTYSDDHPGTAIPTLRTYFEITE